MFTTASFDVTVERAKRTKGRVRDRRDRRDRFPTTVVLHTVQPFYNTSLLFSSKPFVFGNPIMSYFGLIFQNTTRDADFSIVYTFTRYKTIRLSG